MIVLGLDIGSNSVGSAWIDLVTGEITTGLSIFPAGVDESDEKRGDPKNAKRRQVRRTRVTLARRSMRKRQLRLKLIEDGLLPKNEAEFRKLLDETDPWELRRKGVHDQLTPHEFGRVLLHLAQRRGAMGFDAEAGDTGTVKQAIVHVQMEMLKTFGGTASGKKTDQLLERIDALNQKKKRNDHENAELEECEKSLTAELKGLLQNPTVTFGHFIDQKRNERRHPITSPDRRKHKRGPREWSHPVRNKGGHFEFHADRKLIRDEFQKLWNVQKKFGGPLADILTGDLQKLLDNEAGNSIWRHQGLLFGQRRTYWDTGTLGRCVLEPTERCVPHADMHASRYRVIETVNNLKIEERGKLGRFLTPDERTKIKEYLSGPLGEQKLGKTKGQPKRTVSVTDLRELMGWGKATKSSPFRFNIESDEDREINTDWFQREIVHGAIGLETWNALAESVREGINRAILNHDADVTDESDKLKALVMKPWAALDERQADALVAAWRRRPRLDAKRLNMSRRAVRNILQVMDADKMWPDKEGNPCWLTQIAARKQIAAEDSFMDVTTGNQLDEITRRRYLTGAKGATARDRHYMKKHLLRKNGAVIHDPQGLPLAAPPPAPLISNPVVRKAIHEVRRHLIAYMTKFGRKPDEVRVELSREAKMGKKDSDEALFRNRLRNRIRNDIAQTFNLVSLSSTQQRAAVDRVILGVQQRNICALCGDQEVTGAITPRMAADGTDCEVAHIIPRAGGGHNGLNNLVLAHTKCNREMDRQTPRQYWDKTCKGGFEEGVHRVEMMFASVKRPTPADVKTAQGDSLWSCYFEGRPKRFGPTFDELKVAQFKKDIKDIQEMTNRQDAATKYATRQVMRYLADALFGGKGLPERSEGNAEQPEKRLIFATDGLWTSRLRREFGLRFDQHDVRGKGLDSDQQHERKEKDRGDHRHHAIDAVAIALTTQSLQKAWDAREVAADKNGVNTADEPSMENYRRQNRLPLPAPFRDRDEFHAKVQRSIFGDKDAQRPVCHRPVKRKLIGALHEETLLGPVFDRAGKRTDNFTAKKGVLGLDPNHLRLPRQETKEEAIQRIAAERQRMTKDKKPAATKWATEIVNRPDFRLWIIDQPPGKSGIVRDIALRRRLRECLAKYRFVKKNKQGEEVGEAKFLDPDNFTANEIKQAFEAGAICHASGVPIRSVVLLRTMSDPVIIERKQPEYETGKMVPDSDPASLRAYVGGNNHHIEIRVATNKDGKESWNGKVVPASITAKRKIDRLRAIKAAGVPKLRDLRKLPEGERTKWRAVLRDIEKAHPIVDRTDHQDDGKFIMSLSEGETLWMKHKKTGVVGYFVVAKLDKPQSIVLVPHWDARPAGERNDPNDPKKKIPNSKREQFAATPSDLKELAPPGEPHAIKVRVGPLGDVQRVDD